MKYLLIFINDIASATNKRRFEAARKSLSTDLSGIKFWMSEYLEHLKLALKAQEDIRTQLTDEIRNLQNGPRKPKSSQAKLNFYSTTLRKAVEERFALAQEVHNQQIIKENDFVKRLANVQKKQIIMNKYLEDLNEKVNHPVLRKVDSNEEIKAEDLSCLLNDLQEEFSYLEKLEKDINTQVRSARAELHALQQKKTLEKLKQAQQIWDIEVNEEKKLHSSVSSYGFRTSSDGDNLNQFGIDGRQFSRRYSEAGLSDAFLMQRKNMYPYPTQ